MATGVFVSIAAAGIEGVGATIGGSGFATSGSGDVLLGDGAGGGSGITTAAGAEGMTGIACAGKETEGADGGDEGTEESPIARFTWSGVNGASGMGLGASTGGEAATVAATGGGVFSVIGKRGK
jgi:hypothetical protein